MARKRVEPIITPEDRAAFSALVVAPKRELLAAFREAHPEAAARLDAAMKARRERRLERRKTAAEQTRAIVSAYLDGAGLAENAKAIGRTPGYIRKLMVTRGLPLAFPKDARHVAAAVKIAHLAALDAVAADMGASRTEALERLIAYCLEDGAVIARRTLRVARKAAA